MKADREPNSEGKTNGNGLARRLSIAMLGVRGLASDPPPRFRRGDSLLVGGAELAAEELSRALARRGHEVTLFTRQLGGHRVVDNVRLRPAPFVPGRRCEALTHAIAATLVALHEGYDVLHFHAVGPGVCAALAGIAGARTVVTAQGLDWAREKWGPWEGRAIRALASIGARSANGVVAVAPNLLEPLIALGARDVSVIPNGVSTLGEESPATLALLDLEPQRYFLLLSRLVPEKNVHVAIEAYLDAGLSWPLVIAGGGSHSDGYTRRLKSLADGAAGVRFAGVVHGGDRSALLRNAGAFINASSIEGLSLAVLEALGVGLPVGLSTIPGNLDVFRLVGAEPPTDLTFEPGSASSLRNVLRAMELLSETEREAWRTYGKRASARFTWDAIARAHEDVYLRVVDGAPSGPCSATDARAANSVRDGGRRA